MESLNISMYRTKPAKYKHGAKIVNNPVCGYISVCRVYAVRAGFAGLRPTACKNYFARIKWIFARMGAGFHAD
jgi:hypothetical protein